ncbi:MAG: HAD family hydrolase [Gemmatimonadota bacterium]
MHARTDPALVLVDFDDTLVDTAPRFARARRALFDRLERAGFEREAIERIHHHEVDPVMRRDHGFGPHRMPTAFRETYRALCRFTGREPDPDLAAACERLGTEVAGTPPPLDGALDALRRLARALPTALYTQAGNAAYQVGCLREAVPVKTPDAFRETLRGFGVAEPARAWMVGNSLRSDINPALEVGAHAIHVQNRDPWHHDVVEPLHGRYRTVASFHEAVSFLLGNGDPR